MSKFYPTKSNALDTLVVNTGNTGKLRATQT